MSASSESRRSVRLPADVDLHARPAGLLVRAASGYDASVTLHACGKRADAKSILQVLSLEPAHGYGIAQRLEQISRSVVQVNQGSLYPALHRLQQKRWLRGEWKQSETGREAKFYSLTPAGRKQLAVEKDSWARLSGAVNQIFEEGSR